MHRVVAGCNLWALAFFGLALALGELRSPWHLQIGVFAAVFALLAQSAIFALFMGASKLLKEHVRLFSLSADLVDRTNAIMFPLFRWASIGSLGVLLFALLAGLGVSGDVPVWTHVPIGIAAMALLAVAVPKEVRGLAAMHQVLADMEAALPASAGTAGGVAVAPAVTADGIDRRARALVYVGSTTLAMVLGYRFISGLPVPLPVMWAVGGGGALCLVAAGVLALRERLRVRATGPS